MTDRPPADEEELTEAEAFYAALDTAHGYATDALRLAVAKHGPDSAYAQRLGVVALQLDSLRGQAFQAMKPTKEDP